MTKGKGNKTFLKEFDPQKKIGICSKWPNIGSRNLGPNGPQLMMLSNLISMGYVSIDLRFTCFIELPSPFLVELIG